ncbi:MAG: GNAT family N-acetyltransferase [Saprospiraceae bacterium]|nr:GNAT family N-acetyltransferase [Saprospiraceae bacterium]
MTTPAYQLLPLTLKHAGLYSQLINQNLDQLRRHFPVTVRNNHTLTSLKQFIKSKEKLRKERKWFGFLILDGDSEEALGYICLKNVEWTVPKGELAYFLDKQYRGKGIGTWAVNAITSFSFDELELNKLFLLVAEVNIASRRLAMKCGFQQEGFLKKEFRMHTGELVDVFLFGKVRQ